MLVPIAPHALSNRPIVVPDFGEIAIEIVAGRDASVNFDMQSLASLAHGDRIVMRARPTTSASCTRAAGATSPRCAGSCTGTNILRSKASCAKRRHPRPDRSALHAASLAIRDFVIVDALELEFSSGFSVLTGETGAGKSILVDALQLALGGRGDAGVVREGAARPRSAPSSTSTARRRLAGRADMNSTADEGGALLRRTIDTRAARPGSTAAPPPSRSCATWATRWSTSTASTRTGC